MPKITPSPMSVLRRRWIFTFSMRLLRKPLQTEIGSPLAGQQFQSLLKSPESPGGQGRKSRWTQAQSARWGVPGKIPQRIL
jgi:hypothetical protein